MTLDNYNFVIHISDLITHRYTNVSHDVAVFIACQFGLESNFGMSNLAMKHNNYCGMKYAYVRPRTSLKIDGSDFAYYSDLYSCICDYFLALAFHRLKTWDFENVQRFSAAIKNWYCPEKDYINKINSIYQSFKSYKDEQNK